MHASRNHTRRAVLLIVGAEPVDASVWAPSQVLSYLKELRVPLIVWKADRRASEHTPWGRALPVNRIERLEWQAEDLENQLERQWIVWLEGALPAERIELSRPHKKLRICDVAD